MSIRFLAWTFVLTLLAASNPLSGQSDGRLANESQVALSWEDGGVWVSGHLTEVVSGAPVRQAIVQAGTGAALTDSIGWFRLFLGPDLPPEIELRSLEYTTVTLRFAPGETDRVFFFQDMHLAPCEAVVAVGVESTPSRVALFPRSLETGLPAIGRGSVTVRRYGNADSTVVPVEATDGGLTLPISEAGVYSVVLNLQGYETWSRERLVVPYNECDGKRMSNVDEDVWLVPNRARQGPANRPENPTERNPRGDSLTPPDGSHLAKGGKMGLPGATVGVPHIMRIVPLRPRTTSQRDKP